MQRVATLLKDEKACFYFTTNVYFVTKIITILILHVIIFSVYGMFLFCTFTSTRKDTVASRYIFLKEIFE